MLAQVFKMTYAHLTLEVSYKPDAMSSLGIAKLDIKCIYPEKHDLPGANYTPHILTDRSCAYLWPHKADVDDWGGPEAFAREYLNAKSNTRQWQALLKNADQGCLF